MSSAAPPLDTTTPILKPGDPRPGPVIYWMFRDQRSRDNWALLHAAHLAARSSAPVSVAFNLFPRFLGAHARQLGFMLPGLWHLRLRLAALGVPFLPDVGASALVTDFSPLRPTQAAKEEIFRRVLPDVALHEAVDAFLEELIVRRELAENFCFYQTQYESLHGAWEWAQKTLRDPAADKREHIYTTDQLEKAKNHDLLWSASQLEMVHHGKMHGFMRPNVYSEEKLIWDGKDLEHFSVKLGYRSLDPAPTHLTQLSDTPGGRAFWSMVWEQVHRKPFGQILGMWRMYWAKKILEWTRGYEEALAVAIYLNDKYEIDGRDQNGYVGCMLSIRGVHDKGWKERQVFGKIRYMNYAGCKRKFNVDETKKRKSDSATLQVGKQLKTRKIET